jgi:branched-subunit amino acid transport protein
VLRQRRSRIALACVGLLVVAGATAHLVDFGIYHLRIELLNSDSDRGIFEWIAAAAIAAASVAALVLARRRRSRMLAFLGGILFVIFLAGRAHVSHNFPQWNYLYVTLLATSVAIVLGSVTRELRSLVVLAFGVLALSLVLHVVDAHAAAGLGDAQASWLSQVKIALKEGTEGAGWWLVAFALGATAYDERARTYRSAERRTAALASSTVRPHQAP